MEQDMIDATVRNLEKNQFEVHLVADLQEAKRLFLETLLPAIRPRTVSCGDSMTMLATGVLDELRKDPELVLIDQTIGEHSATRKAYWRRRVFTADLFLSGTNAITRQGQLVNVDMIGNRVSAITFGPTHVVLFVGTNKITDSMDAAVQRVQTVAAPLNAIRHTNLRTPCQKTRTCMDCQSPDRLCNTWVITQKSFPRHRVKIVLINQPLGL